MFLRFASALCLLMLFSLPARSGDFCVDSVAELVAAVEMFESQSDGTVYSIKIVQGTYVVGNQLGAGYSTFPRSVGLSIKGGYNAGCTSRSMNPANTVIDGNNQTGSAISFSTEDDANLYIEGITFTRLVGGNQPAFSVSSDLDTTELARHSIRHCRFIRSSGSSIVFMSSPEMRFINNLVANNLPNGFTPTAVNLRYAYDAYSGVIATNNTIVTNAGAGLTVADYDEQPSVRVTEITNNILWDNAVDLNLAEFNNLLNPIFVEGNNYEDFAGAFVPSSSNVTSNPLFINMAASNYGLSPGSPAINAGFLFQSLGYPTKDLGGDERIIGTQIDRGAYESLMDDRVSFVVTTVGDNGNNTTPLAGSLRAAIKAANAAAGPYRISFAIAGACPRIIQMNTTMLDVTGDVTIDARTQPGWSPNTFFGRSDANLCIALNGSGATAHAFRVPASAGNNARLAVFGMMFAGFTDAALRIENGHDHRIAGDQFGAVPFTANNGAAVRVTGASGGAFIGGYDDPALMNLIAGSTVAGIYLDNTSGGSTIANNIIGYQIDGTSPGPNEIGVFVFNSPGNHLQYNFIGYNESTGITVSGAASQANEIQYNGIGSDWTGGIPGNLGAGVAIVFGARNNTVGAPITSSFGGNTITRNTGPGVWISPSGGIGNRVLANTFVDNDNVDIDLASAGPTANQASNPGSGPNRLQNFPALSSALRSSGSNQTLTVTGTLHSAPSNSYRVDIYLGDCDPSAPGRGTGSYWVGWLNASTDAQGNAGFTKTYDLPSWLSTNLGAASATATSATGDTSEFGACLALGSGNLPIPLFKHGFE